MRKVEFQYDFEEGRYHLLYHTQPGRLLIHFAVRFWSAMQETLI